MKLKILDTVLANIILYKYDYLEAVYHLSLITKGEDNVIVKFIENITDKYRLNTIIDYYSIAHTIVNNNNNMIIPVRYKNRYEYGDFYYMIKSGEYNDALFIFNDNDIDHNTSVCGGGNAIIRPYNKYGKYSEYPRSAGIPTGDYMGGYKLFTDSVKKEIDSSIDEIVDLINVYKYKKIYYSESQHASLLLGTSIFSVEKNILAYITTEIHRIPSRIS